MKQIVLIAAAVALSACVKMPTDDPVRMLGGGLYEISEMRVYGGSVVSHAARYCQAEDDREVMLTAMRP